MSQTHVDPKVQDKVTQALRKDLQEAIEKYLTDQALERLWKVQVLSTELIKWIMM